MLLTPDCLTCVYKASLSALRRLTSDERLIRRLVAEIMSLPSMRGRQWDITSPEVFEQAFVAINTAFGTDDPFKDLKNRQTRKALELYPCLKSLVADSSEPLRTAALLAIVGNSLDLLWSEGSVDVEPIIEANAAKPLSDGDFEIFQRRLDHANSLVILGDNSGETVFDRILIETIRETRNPEIVYVVRSRPALNDATLKEAEESGLHVLATVLENGVNGPVPGTILRRCSPRVAELLRSADLILSKGGGNFDSLEEETELLDRIIFMLMSKCVPYCSYFGKAMYEPILSPARSK